MRVGTEDRPLKPIKLHELYLLKNLLAEVGVRASARPESEGGAAVWVLLEELQEEEMLELVCIATGLSSDEVEENFTLSWIAEILDELGGLAGLGGWVGAGKGKENSSAS